MDKRKQEYLKTQHDHGLKIGDFVKVVRRAWSHQFGWQSLWLKGMSEHIGKIYEIETIQNSDGIMLRGTNLWFPHFILQKVAVVVIKDLTVDDPRIPLLPFERDWESLNDEEKAQIRFGQDKWLQGKWLPFPNWIERGLFKLSQFFDKDWHYF